jgi:hypothetical protein
MRAISVQRIPEKLQMAMAFPRLREGKWEIWKHWHKIIEEANNPVVQRENGINCFKNCITQMCLID